MHQLEKGQGKPGCVDEQSVLTVTGGKGGDLSARRSQVMGSPAEKLKFHVSDSVGNQDRLLRR